MKEKKVVSYKIALLASPSYYQGPDSLLIRFVREFEPFLMHQYLYATEGIWRSIRTSNLLVNYQNFEFLRPKRAGGLVEVAAMVVGGDLDVVIFLIDPRDPSSIYPECTALKRDCVAYKKFFLATYASAVEWASLVWLDPSSYTLSPEELERIEKAQKIKLITDLSSQTIALIAHDKMKIEMIQFVNNHRNLLSKFEGIIGTGTTGRLLKGEEKRGELDTLLKGRGKEEKKDLDQAIKEIRRLKLRLEKMQEKLSGPKGGDVQIGNQVVKGKCHKVIFFEDPFMARAWEPDIQLLERTCQIYGESVVCFSDPISADLWASAWKQREGRYRDFAPVTLMHALEKYLASVSKHNVRVILARTGSDEKKTIRNVCRIAGWYLNTLITKMGGDKAEVGEELTIVIPWGTIMGELVEEVKNVIAQIQEKSKAVPNLITLPMIALMNSENPDMEANRLAEKLAEELFGGKHYSISIGTFIYKTTDLGSQVEEVLRRFKKADIVLLHGKPIVLPGTHFGTVTRAPADPEMVQDVYKRKAICEISGLFLNEDGDEVPLPHKFQRVGMSYKQLQDAGNNTECRSIMLIGTPDERTEDYIKMAKATFRAQFPSVLITDVTFARRLLGLKEGH